MENLRLVPAWQRALIALSATVIGVVVVGTLYWAQVVFIPLALAIFLAFMLNPYVRALQRWGWGRVPSVLAVVMLAATLLSMICWLLVWQTTELLRDLPKYSATIRQKIQSVRGLGAGAQRMIDDIADDLKGKAPLAVELPEGPAVAVPLVNAPATELPAWVTSLPGYLGSIAHSLTGLALVVVLLFFLLLRREHFRSRFLRLVGQGGMSLPTKAVDDAGQRISRFLLMQAVVNGGVGVAVGLGLLAIGIERAFFWGLLAGILRYIPYIGVWIAAVPLLAVCLGIPEWAPILQVLGLFLLIEVIAANFVEPRLYGQSIGVSEVAFLVAAVFWAFLWGPIGLVLSSPLTVCLLVLGRHVPQLHFLQVLLGDDPVLNPRETFYQRLLAHDADEAAELAAAHAQQNPETVFDDLLAPALSFTKRDRQRGELTDADEQFVLRASREIMDDLSQDSAKRMSPQADGDEDLDAPRVLVWACPARDSIDRLALEMLKQLLDPAKWQLEIAGAGLLTAELLAHAAELKPALICIGAVPPGGLTRTRYLCKLLRARFPEVKIIVGRWDFDEATANREALSDAGADFVAGSLLETRNQMQSWFPVLAQEPLVGALR